MNRQSGRAEEEKDAGEGEGNDEEGGEGGGNCVGEGGGNGEEEGGEEEEQEEEDNKEEEEGGNGSWLFFCSIITAGGTLEIESFQGKIFSPSKDINVQIGAIENLVSSFSGVFTVNLSAPV